MFMNTMKLGIAADLEPYIYKNSFILQLRCLNKKL